MADISQDDRGIIAKHPLKSYGFEEADTVLQI
jgi:hypothetical protein